MSESSFSWLFFGCGIVHWRQAEEPLYFTKNLRDTREKNWEKKEVREALNLKPKARVKMRNVSDTARVTFRSRIECFVLPSPIFRMASSHRRVEASIVFKR